MKKLEELLKDFEPSLAEITHMSGSPMEVYDPINYILEIGGKRIRPALVLASYKLYNDQYNSEVFELAKAVEMFHNFTLLHDDIMDHSELRRGKPTAHVKWDESTAILAGDLLQIKVYQKLARIGNVQVLDLFNSMATSLCEGQMSDMLFETREDVSNDEYLIMIRQKTAVLLAFCLQSGALLGGASLEESHQLYELGINIGLSFQLMDDYLDTFGQKAKVGKRIGGDILEKKKTYLWNEMWSKLGQDEKHQISAYYQLPEEETIANISNKMDKIGAKESTLNLANQYSTHSLELIHHIKTRGNKEYLTEIVNILAGRES
jgi:geranylgeranyl diphosphate synthase type II